MKWLDSIFRVFILTQGTGLRWLRAELGALKVRIPLTDGCLAEFLYEADEAVRRAGIGRGQSYVERLRRQLAARAAFVQKWTGSDDPITFVDSESLPSLVRIARKYALPRPWKLSEPVVVEYQRIQPSYWTWASDVDADAVPQS